MSPVVLVVDDNELVRLTVSRGLTRAGFRVVEAATGKDALCRVGEADVVLQDVNLPDMTGPQLLRAMRHKTPVGIVAFSGLDPHEIGRGYDAKVQKPARIRDIIDVLSEQLSVVHRLCLLEVSHVSA